MSDYDHAHAALLADVHSNEQQASLVTKLQQSHGNAYVQRVACLIQAKRDETLSERKSGFSVLPIHASGYVYQRNCCYCL